MSRCLLDVFKREELLEAEEVGGKIADGIADFFADPANLRIIERLRAAGLQFEAQARQLKSQALEGLSFVISGKFSAHSRDELKELIEAHGGRNLAAVSANVDFLIAGDNMGPAKLKKAEKLGIKLISEQDFEQMISGDGGEAAAPAETPAQTAPAPEQGTLF